MATTVNSVPNVVLPVERADRSDVVIAGGSFAGMALALALVQTLGPSLRITLVDKAPTGPAGNEPDPRASAISAGSRNLLDVLGLWPEIAPEAEAVRRIEITDSPLEAGVRPVLLTYDNLLADGSPASHIVPNTVLARALARAVAATPSIRRVANAAIGFQADHVAARVDLADGARLVADLVVAADGRHSSLREAAGLKVTSWPYQQTGIVTLVSHDRPHEGTAVQHFLPAGPFAMLPLPGNRTCITWSEESARAATILAMSDADFLAEIDLRVGGRLGTLALAGPRRSWPLEMHLARAYVASRFALVGDAAHGVHPIAGQGLNLAFRDVGALAECIAESARLGFDLGSHAALERYERWRRFDSATSATAFDALNRLFSADQTLLRSTRELGLGIVDRLAPIKRLLVDEAAGLSGEVPRLLRGLPV